MSLFNSYLFTEEEDRSKNYLLASENNIHLNSQYVFVIRLFHVVKEKTFKKSKVGIFNHIFVYFLRASWHEKACALNTITHLETGL